jgi:hypothetical protein
MRRWIIQGTLIHHINYFSQIINGLGYLELILF